MAYGVFIYDAGNYRIKLLDEAWEERKQFGETGVAGSDNSHLGVPSIYTSNLLTSDGTYLYLWDTGNYRIIKINPVGLEYVSEYGSQGSGDDQLGSVGSICCDGSYLYILDSDNNRIIKRNLDLTFDSKATTPNDYAASSIKDARSICVYGSNLFITSTGAGPSFLGQVMKWTTASPPTWVASVNHDRYPDVITADANYIYYGDTWSTKLNRRDHNLANFTQLEKGVQFTNFLHIYSGPGVPSATLFHWSSASEPIRQRRSAPDWTTDFSLPNYITSGSGPDQVLGVRGLILLDPPIINPTPPPSAYPDPTYPGQAGGPTYRRFWVGPVINPWIIGNNQPWAELGINRVRLNLPGGSSNFIGSTDPRTDATSGETCTCSISGATFLILWKSTLYSGGGFTRQDLFLRNISGTPAIGNVVTGNSSGQTGTVYNYGSAASDYCYQNTQAFDFPITYDAGRLKYNNFSDPENAWMEFDQDGVSGLPEWYVGSSIFDNWGETWCVVVAWDTLLRPSYIYPSPVLVTTKIYFNNADPYFYLVINPEVSGSGPYMGTVTPIGVNHGPSVISNYWYDYVNDGLSVVTEVGVDAFGNYMKVRPDTARGYSQITIITGDFWNIDDYDFFGNTQYAQTFPYQEEPPVPANTINNFAQVIW